MKCCRYTFDLLDKGKVKMASIISYEGVMELLDWTYDKAVNGLGVVGMDSAIDLAEDYSKQEGQLVEQINSLIRWQNTKSVTSGFVTGLGGIITLPVAIPANVASVMYVQIRMIAAIAHMCGFDVKDDRVKTIVYACLTGNAAVDILKNAGVVIGTKMSTQLIKSISFETIKAINKAVGFRLVTKFGEKGVINLGKAVPVVGGIISGTIDGVSTNTIGNIARNTFIEASKPDNPGNVYSGYVV